MQMRTAFGCALLSFWALACHDWDSLAKDRNASDASGNGENPMVDASTPCSEHEVYADKDGDGYGDRNWMMSACEPPAGFVTNNDDCDDDCAACHPEAKELCTADRRDENCDGSQNEGCACTPAEPTSCGPATDGNGENPMVDASTPCTEHEVYADKDGDGYGDRNWTMSACEPPAGFVTNNDDCDDDCAACHPEAKELCTADRRDENCDGSQNEGCACTPAEPTSCGPATDQGECVFGSQLCGENASWGICEGAVLAADETCNGLDDDCDGMIDDGVFNACGACGAAPVESCDGIDNDCDSHIDEDTDPLCTWRECGNGACGTVAEISAGGGNPDAHTCARLTTGAVYCWGANTSGQLGHGHVGTNTSKPVRVVAPSGNGYLEGALAVTAGENHTCALLATSIVCWGGNTSGQLGDSSAGASSARPVTVQAASGVSLSGVRAIDAGKSFTCAVLSDQSVACWGDDQYGQLGRGTSGSGSVGYTAARVLGIAGIEATLTGVERVSSGMAHACALLGSGAVRCWGYNARGQVGNGAKGPAPVSQPVAVRNGLNSGDLVAAAVTAGGSFSCVRFSGGEASCWGDNSSGQLGTDTAGEAMSLPVVVGGGGFSTLRGVSQIEAGLGAHVCARLSSGQGACWGGNYWGQLGNGASGSTAASMRPVGVLQVGEQPGGARMTDITAFSLGPNHSCALRSDASIACWGSDETGQLGHGSGPNPSLTPLQVSNPQ